jgi:hypothetical protein
MRKKIYLLTFVLAVVAAALGAQSQCQLTPGTCCRDQCGGFCCMGPNGHVICTERSCV